MTELLLLGASRRGAPLGACASCQVLLSEPLALCYPSIQKPKLKLELLTAKKFVDVVRSDANIACAGAGVVGVGTAGFKRQPAPPPPLRSLASIAEAGERFLTLATCSTFRPCLRKACLTLLSRCSGRG